MAINRLRNICPITTPFHVGFNFVIEASNYRSLGSTRCWYETFCLGTPACFRGSCWPIAIFTGRKGPSAFTVCAISNRIFTKMPSVPESHAQNLVCLLRDTCRHCIVSWAPSGHCMLCEAAQLDCYHSNDQVGKSCFGICMDIVIEWTFPRVFNVLQVAVHTRPSIPVPTSRFHDRVWAVYCPSRLQIEIYKEIQLEHHST